ncbi:MAG: tetratricopeptide repeat protein [Coleofasciculaceae cyanobacterium SM2_3_26]|nr:tetratricopeptide repeat protein [Coleofasciculaceae cyanobacterium SM2_3_26]
MKLQPIGFSTLLAILIAVPSVPQKAEAKVLSSREQMDTLNNGVQIPQPVETARQQDMRQLMEAGKQRFNAGDFSGAIAAWEEALTLFRKAGNPTGEAVALGCLGTAYQSLGNHRMAVQMFEQSLANPSVLPNREFEGYVSLALGDSYMFLDDYPKAIVAYRRSLDLAQDLDDPELQGKSLTMIGLAYYNLEEYATGMTYFQQNLIVAQRTNARPRAGICAEVHW